MTKPNAEKQTSKRLTKLGIENYLPLQRELRVWHDRKKWVEVPLFKSYVFIKTTDRLRYEVFTISNIVKYVCIAGQVCVLREQEIERIQNMCASDSAIIVEKTTSSPWVLGEEVEIMEGALKGFRGYLTQKDGQHRLKVAIEGLGYFANIIVDENIVRKTL